VIDFRIHYPRNFIFRFLINYDWSRSWLYSLGERDVAGSSMDTWKTGWTEHMDSER